MPARSVSQSRSWLLVLGSPFVWTAILFAAASLAATPVSAADPLHQRIDAAVSTNPLGPVAGICSDADFVRRASLDLTGMQASGPEAKAFLDDPAPDKRAKLIDRLIASPRFARHLANTFSTTLMERRGDSHVPAAEWQKFLYESFLANKPYDQLVREILTSDGTDPALRPAAKFFLERTAEPNLMTRDIGRVFFGRDLQCAQCHDSPLIDDFRQPEYYGLQAFVARTVMFNDEAAKKQVLGEKADGEVSFASVFTKETGMSAPRVPFGGFSDDPLLPIGEEYNVRPADKVRPVPKYSRRTKLAEAVTTTNNVQFQRNFANRLWAMMLGRGIVHPLDLHHSDNPPTNPELLELLTAEVAATKYDMRHMLREIALSQTYQRSGELPADWTAPSSRAAELLTALTAAETASKSDIDAAKEAAKPSDSEFDAAKKSAVAPREEFNKAIAAAVEARKQLDAAQAALDKTQAAIAPKQDLLAPITATAAKAAEALAKLPNDSDLKKATELFQAREKTLITEIAALTKTRDDQAAAAKAKNDAFAAANTAINPVREKWLAEKAKLDVAREKYEAAQAVLRAKTVATKLTSKRIASLKTLAEFNALAAKGAASQAALTQAQANLNAAQQALTQAPDEAAKKAAEAKVAELTPPVTAAAQAAKSAADALQAARETVLQFGIEHFYVAALKPLTPEQLAASSLQATTYIDNQTKTAIAELDKATAAPPAAGQTQPVPPVAPLGGRDRQIEESVFTKLVFPNTGSFVAQFGGGPGQPQDVFYATADQALFYGNGGTIHSWAGVLASAVTAQQDVKQLTDDIYLHTLNRRASDEELAAVAKFLQSRPDARNAVLQEIIWALLSSAEFRFNH